MRRSPAPPAGNPFFLWPPRPCGGFPFNPWVVRKVAFGASRRRRTKRLSCSHIPRVRRKPPGNRQDAASALTKKWMRHLAVFFACGLGEARGPIWTNMDRAPRLMPTFRADAPLESLWKGSYTAVNQAATEGWVTFQPTGVTFRINTHNETFAKWTVFDHKNTKYPGFWPGLRSLTPVLQMPHDIFFSSLRAVRRTAPLSEALWGALCIRIAALRFTATAMTALCVVVSSVG